MTIREFLLRGQVARRLLGTNRDGQRHHYQRQQTHGKLQHSRNRMPRKQTLAACRIVIQQLTRTAIALKTH